MSASNGFADDYLIEKAYDSNSNIYTWNTLPDDMTDVSYSFDENNRISSVLNVFANEITRFFRC